MNVASLENCKRLYELSGWKTPYFFTEEVLGKDAEYQNIRYDSGYLLRKLPKETAHNNVLALITEWEDSFYSGYAERNNEGDYTIDSVFYKNCERADTPEDALCLLAIKLFEEGLI